MRVHNIISDYSNVTGGAERAVRVLHRGLLDREIDSHLLGLIKQKDPKLAGAESLGLNSPYGLRALYGIYQYLQRNIEPDDIVHVHLFPPFYHLAILKLFKQIQCHLVYTEHSTSNRRRGRLMGRILDANLYAYYDRIVAISNGVSEELLKWQPQLVDKMAIIRNGVNLGFAHVIQRELRRPLRVVSVGNLRAAKNYDMALQAVALLEDLEFEYCIAGEGKYERHLRALCKDLGLDTKVKFLGYVHPISSLLASADVFLIPSKWEGFGLAAVEAMNATLPLIASDISGLREIVDGKATCALLVDPEKPQTIAEALRRLLCSDEMRSEFGQNAFAQAQKFSKDRMIEGYLKLYREIYDQRAQF